MSKAEEIIYEVICDIENDFENKCRVYEVEEKGITVYQTVEHSTTDYNWISFDEIEEVVTKEMMEIISYKVK